jgi:hypothetical protein
MDRSVLRSRDIQVQSGQKWVGGRQMGPRRHREHEGRSARAGGHSVVAGVRDGVGGWCGQSVRSGAGASDDVGVG